MKDVLKPHRDFEAEKELKAIIQEIQSILYEPGNDSRIEAMLKDAAKYIKAPGWVLDVTVIEGYEGWTDLDGLVGELTMEVPKLDVSKEDFQSIVREIRKVIESGEEPDGIRLDNWMDFYRDFLELNFPNIDTDGLFEGIFENTPMDELVRIAFPQA